jgi:hypothetical protein
VLKYAHVGHVAVACRANAREAMTMYVTTATMNFIRRRRVHAIRTTMSPITKISAGQTR